MSIFKAIIGAITGLVIGIIIHIQYVAPSIQGVTELLESGILTLALVGLLSYTGYKWEENSP